MFHATNAASVAEWIIMWSLNSPTSLLYLTEVSTNPQRAFFVQFTVADVLTWPVSSSLAIILTCHDLNETVFNTGI